MKKPFVLIIGRAYRVFYDHGNLNNRTLHIRAVVDQCNVVIAWKRRGYWRYSIESIFFFESLHEDGRIRILPKTTRGPQ